MDVDTATSVTQTPAKHSLPELEIYCYLLVLIFLIDQKRYNEVSNVKSLLSFHVLLLPAMLVTSTNVISG